MSCSSIIKYRVAHISRDQCKKHDVPLFRVSTACLMIHLVYLKKHDQLKSIGYAMINLHENPSSAIS